MPKALLGAQSSLLEKVLGEAVWGFLGRVAVLVGKSIFLDSEPVVGHSGLPAVKVIPVESVGRHGANS